MDIDKIPAGEELDKLIGEDVFGWRWVTNSKGSHGWACEGLAGNLCATDEQFKKWDEDNSKDKGWVAPYIPSYSTNIAAAWEVVEKMSDCLHLRQYGKQGIWEAVFCGHPGSEGHGETAPLAICRAALRAVKEAD